MTTTISQNNAPFSKTTSAHWKEFLNKRNYSELNVGGLVVLFLVREEHGKLTVFSTQVRDTLL